ncbi:MAG: hypothetical protein ACXVZX_03460 [Terriglobales bacterium]
MPVALHYGGCDRSVAFVAIVERNRQTGREPDPRFQPSQQLSKRDYLEKTPEEADKILELLGAVGQGIIPICIVDSVEDNDNGFVSTEQPVKPGAEDYPPRDGLDTVHRPVWEPPKHY